MRPIGGANQVLQVIVLFFIQPKIPGILLHCCPRDIPAEVTAGL
jgi:hypothetical protein